MRELEAVVDVTVEMMAEEVRELEALVDVTVETMVEVREFEALRQLVMKASSVTLSAKQEI